LTLNIHLSDGAAIMVTHCCSGWWHQWILGYRLAAMLCSGTILF